MKRVIRLAVVDPNDNSRAQLKNLLLGVDTVWLEAECSRYEYFMDVGLQTQPDIALVTLDSNPASALELISKLRQQIPACAVLAVSSSQEGSLILQAMRNGAQEFLSIPLNLEDFLAALERVRHSTYGQGDVSDVIESQVITVAGVNGGVGSTSVAVNLACVLAQNPRHTVGLIDLENVRREDRDFQTSLLQRALELRQLDGRAFRLNVTVGAPHGRLHAAKS